MRDDYQVSTAEVDLLVELRRENAAVFGARLTGGGFGGCVVILVRPQMGNAVAASVLSAYQQRFPRQGIIMIAQHSQQKIRGMLIGLPSSCPKVIQRPGPRRLTGNYRPSFACHTSVGISSFSVRNIC
jgi:hypothetical protein